MRTHDWMIWELLWSYWVWPGRLVQKRLMTSVWR